MEKKGKDNMSTPSISRRKLLRLLGTGVGAAVLAGCAPKVVETAAPTSAPQVAPKATEVPKPVSLSYQNHWTKETDAHFKGMEWLYKEFQAHNSGITIENILNPDSQESYKKITADCAAGDCPDIIHGPGPEMWDAGYLLDLKPYIEKDAAWKDP